MRIDSHQHYWIYDAAHYGWISNEMPKLKRNVLPQDIKATLETYRIDGVIAVQARQNLEENQFLLNLSEEYLWIKGVVGWVDIRSQELAEQLDFYQKTKMKGFRHLIQDEHNPSAFFEDEKFNQGIEKLLASGYLYEVLCYEKDLKAAINFCKKHDNSPLIIDHLGKPSIANNNSQRWRKELKELASLPHVFCKLSGMVTEAKTNWVSEDIYPFIDHAIEVFSPDRLMFGSDWPVCQLGGTYENVYDLIETTIADLTLSEQASIMGNVACRVYKL
ncbi:amidohydrolase family protein [Ignatzschineria sp. LJL83]